MTINMRLSWTFYLLMAIAASEWKLAAGASFSVCECSDVPAGCFLHSNLSSALAIASGFPCTQVTATSAADDYEQRVEEIELNTTVEISAGGQRLVATGEISIERQASVTISNCTLEMDNFELGVVRVLGTLKIECCAISGWKKALFLAMAGVLWIDQSVLSRNTADTLIKADGTNILISHSEFIDNQGALMVYTWQLERNANVALQNCTIFRNSGSALFQVNSDFLMSTARIDVSDCVLSDNRGLLFDFHMNGGVVIVEKCSGAYNSGGVMRLQGSVSFAGILNCSWSHTDFPVLWIPSALEGLVSVSDTSISANAYAAPIHITDGGSASKCQIALTNITMTDNYIITEFSSAAIIYAASCSVSMSHFVARNCTSQSPILEMNFAAILVQSGILEMRNVTIEESGGPGLLVLFLLSFGTLEGVKIRNADVGGSALITLFGSSVSLRYMEVVNGEFSIRKRYSEIRMTVLFVEIGTLLANNLSLRHIDVENLMVMVGFGAHFQCDSISLFNVSGLSLVVQTSTYMQLTNVTCQLTKLIVLFMSSGKSESAVSDISIQTSQFSRAMFVINLSGLVAISNLSVSETSSQALLTAGFSTVVFRSVTMTDSDVDITLNSVLQSVVTLIGLKVQNSVGALMSAAVSKVSLIDCLFADIRTEKSFIKADESELVVISSRFQGIASRRLVNLAKNSTLRLADSGLFSVQCALNSMISSKDSSVDISRSTLSQISTNVLDGRSTTVNIAETLIEQVGYGYVPGSITQYQFGGAIYCTDCPSINIRATTVRGTSADLGGAVYAFSAEPQSALRVDSSVFENCWANSGGAMYLRNVSFIVSRSTFKNSYAEESGGALDINVREKHQREISNCEFERNSAFEGGAVKWRSSQPVLANCTFSNNTATYGPDVASFGIQVAATEVGVIAPGQPTDLNFTLLDHYSQRVVTGKSQMLVLQSSSDLSYGGIGYKVVESGFFNFSSRIFYASANSTHTLIALFEDVTADYSVHYEYSQELVFRDCEIGEIKTTNSCISCPAGYYSFNISDSKCTLCPTIASCPGGSVVVPRSGAWRTNGTEVPVLQCPIASACEVTVDSACSQGYEGPLCGHCASGWFSLVFATCRKCPHPALIWTECGVVAVIGIVFVIAMVRWKSERKMQMLAVFVRHLQLIGLLSYFHTEYPLMLEVFFHLALSVSTLGTANFPMQCFGWDYSSQAIATALLYPSLIVSVILISVLSAMKSRTMQQLRVSLWRALTFVSSLVPQVAMMGMLPLFACVEVGAERKVLAIDTNIVCWRHESKLTYIAASGLAISTILPIAVHFFNIYRQRCQRNLRKTAWSVLEQCLNVCISVSFLLQMNYSPRSQLFIPFLFLLCSSVLIGLFLCFGNDCELGFAQYSTFTLIGTYSLLFYFLEYEEKSMGSVFAALVIVGNAVFLVSGVWRAAAKEAPAIKRPQEHCSQGDLIAPHNSGISLENIQLALDDSVK